MKTLSLSVCMAFAFFVASAAAQATPGAQGTQNSSPSMSQPGQQQPGYGQQPGTQQPGMDQQTSDQTTKNQDNGERTIKGCVQSQGGQYTLETKKGKEVALAGQDVSAHVGHEVKLKGTWQNGNSMSATSSSSSSSASGAERTFNVTNVKMVSETCKNSSNMGNSGSNSGSSTPNSSGSSTQPPQ